MSVWQIDDEDYHMISLDLKSQICNRIFDDAKAAGKLPISMKDLSIEMIDLCESWCQTNCKSDYLIDPMYRLQIFFKDPKEAMLFKLTHG